MIFKGNNKAITIYKGTTKIAKAYKGSDLVYTSESPMGAGAIIENGRLTRLAEAFGMNEPVTDAKNHIFSNLQYLTNINVTARSIEEGTDPDGNPCVIMKATMNYPGDGFHFTFISDNKFISWMTSRSTNTYIDIDARYQYNPTFTYSVVKMRGNVGYDYEVKPLTVSRAPGTIQINPSGLYNYARLFYDYTGGTIGTRELILYIYSMSIR